MTVGYATALRNSRLDAVKAAMDAGSGAGKLRIYDGARPATGGTVTTLLAELTLSDPSAPAASGGVLTMNAITQDSSADASGTATWARVVDSDNNFVLDASVSATGGGGDVQLSSTTIVATGAVTCSSFVITGGNP